VSVLERVRWPAVLDDLYGGADTDRRQAADWYASRIDAPLAHHARLAVLATTAGPRLLSCLVEAHGREVPAEPVAGWCYWTSRTLFGGLQAEINRPRLTVTDGTGPMHVDPWLPALPLLGVAAEHAARAGQLLVLKAADDLPPAVQGHCGRAVQATIVGRGGQRRAETVTLVQLRRGTSDPGGIWRHELGHVVDPRPGERTSAEGERFADDLAELLAARPPTTWPPSTPSLSRLRPARRTARPPRR
jgi:hypothetical protein